MRSYVRKAKTLVPVLALGLLLLSSCAATVGPKYDCNSSATLCYGYARPYPYYYAPRPLVLRSWYRSCCRPCYGKWGNYRRKSRTEGSSGDG